MNHFGELNPFYGKKHSEETKLKISKAHKGKKLTEEHKQKIREYNLRIGRKPPSHLGKHRTDEQKIRYSLSKTGEKNPSYGKHLTEDQKKYLSEVQRKLKTGLKLSEETKKKISDKRKGKYLGSDNPNWRGGTTGRLQKEGWIKIRNSIYERDKWTCQECGNHCTNKNIHCHHKIPYRVTQDDSPENLTTLCNKCHMTIERKYWKGLGV